MEFLTTWTLFKGLQGVGLGLTEFGVPVGLTSAWFRVQHGASWDVVATYSWAWNCASNWGNLYKATEADYQMGHEPGISSYQVT